MSKTTDRDVALQRGRDGVAEMRANPMMRRCVECDRRFDLMDEMDADEWAYGHDCEA